MDAARIVRGLRELGSTKIRESRSRVTASCPFASNHKGGRDRHPSFSVKVDPSGKSPYHCFACGESGLMEKLLGIDDLDYLKRRMAWLERTGTWIAPDNDKVWTPGPSVYVEDGMAILPPSAFAPYRGRVPQYAIDRGLTLETCKAWDLGYDKPNKRLLFTVKDREGRLVGVTSRKIEVKEGESVWGPKYLHYVYDPQVGVVVPFLSKDRDKDEGIPLPRNRVLYGGHMIDYSADTLIVVEGNMDALMLWQKQYNAVAVLGIPSEDHAELLIGSMKLGARYYVMLDPDNAGSRGTHKLVEWMKDRVMVYRCSLVAMDGPADREKVDPGNATDLEVTHALQTATLCA